MHQTPGPPTKSSDLIDPVHRYEILLLSCSLLSVDQLGFVVKALPIANTHARLDRLMPGEGSFD